MADEAPKTLMEALLRVQAEVPKLKLGKDSEGQIGSRKYKYLTLDKLHDEVLPLLNRHGLVWLTRPMVTGTDHPPVLYYELRAANDGYRPVGVEQMGHIQQPETISGVMPLMLSENTSQALGSAITYARRYALTAVVGAVADEDDDGAKASEQPTQALRTPKPRTPPAPEDRELTAQELGAMRDAIKRAGQDEYLLLAKAGVDKTVRLSHARDIRDTLDRLEGSGK